MKATLAKTGSQTSGGRKSRARGGGKPGTARVVAAATARSKRKPVVGSHRAAAPKHLIDVLVLRGKLEAIDQVEQGIPVHIVGEAAKTFGVTKEALLKILDVSRATVSRMERRNEALDVLRSDVFKDAASVLNKALVMLGNDRESLRGWVERPVPALGRSPIDLLRTKDGRELVNDILDRAVSGAYA